MSYKRYVPRVAVSLKSIKKLVQRFQQGTIKTLQHTLGSDYKVTYMWCLWIIKEWNPFKYTQCHYQLHKKIR